MTLPAPYYQDDWATIYHADCRTLLDELAFDVIVTDPPYGIDWRRDEMKAIRGRRGGSPAQEGILNDGDTSCRDEVLRATASTPAVVFGSFLAEPPLVVAQTLVWLKPPDAGFYGSVAGYRRDLEPVFLVGPSWGQIKPDRLSSALLTSHERSVSHLAKGNGGHPHTKPRDLMQSLIERCPPGVILDPFMGSGTTLRAAKDLGRHSIGIEIDERYCEVAARRLGQEVLDLGSVMP